MPSEKLHAQAYNLVVSSAMRFLLGSPGSPKIGRPKNRLQCGILVHGFLRLGCDTCKKEILLAFSCKRRGCCPSCAGRRMAQTAAHLVERVLPWVPTRQWVVSVPVPLRDWMAASQELTAQVHTIIRTTIGQYYVNKAVTRGCARANIQPGSVTFIQRFGSALNVMKPS